MTYLEMVNAVLRRLREDEVSTMTSTDYSKLIKDYVIEAVQEVEGARNWNALRTTISVVTSAGTYTYALTDVPAEFAIQVIHVEGDDYDLIKSPNSAWLTHKYLSDTDQDKPRYYDINGVDSNGDPQLDVWPIPDAAYTMYVALKQRTTDSPTDSTVIVLPTRPILLRAFMFALEERGDNGGDSLQLLEARYRDALSSAAAYDMLLNEDESEWIEV